VLRHAGEIDAWLSGHVVHPEVDAGKARACGIAGGIRFASDAASEMNLTPFLEQFFHFAWVVWFWPAMEL
jgi:hypothetical protein